MNTNALVVQRAWDRPIMSSFHVVYGVGGFLGAAAGGLFARQGASAPTAAALAVRPPLRAVAIPFRRMVVSGREELLPEETPEARAQLDLRTGSPRS